MNIKVLTAITTLSLCFIFGFSQVTYSLNEASQNDISELRILNYIPKDNKTLFISNSKSSKIIHDIRKNYGIKNQDKLDLIKNSLLAYLGIDLNKQKFEEIYGNELSITSYDNKEQNIDDILIIFKINEKKNIDDVLNLSNKIDEPEKLIQIYRKNKLSFLNYIYRTNDNYILTSSSKKIILEALKSSNTSKKNGTKYTYFRELLNNFKNVNNILLTKNFKANELLNNEKTSLLIDNYLATLFDFKDENITLKSYLINNKKNLNIMSYKKIDKENILDKTNYQIVIYNDLLNSKKYLKNLGINSFENSILKELDEKLSQNLLFLVSEKNWVIIFDKNNLSLESIKLLEDFNKNSLKNNNNIYTIYSKDKLEKENNIVKQAYSKKIFSVQSDNLNLISNNLINDIDIDLISKEFLEIKGNSYAKYFLNKQIYLKYPYPIYPKDISYLENINYLFKNVIDVSIIEFKSIIKQSIPETNPMFYAETNFKIF